MTRLTTVLDRKLAEKEAALSTEYARRQEEARMVAQAEERQRIMADMHDGVGARPLGLAADAQDGDRPARDLVPDIHGAVDELRLIVNALDAVGDDLIGALTGFRQTVEPKMTSAGFALDWRVDRTVRLAGLETGATLQLYRILQEACANAMRHSGGDVIRISLTRDGAAISLAVGDNGRGGIDPAAAGYGLKTMADRARRIGAAFKVGDSALGGGEVRLRFEG
jgi:signal transduction histidine kinase